MRITYLAVFALLLPGCAPHYYYAPAVVSTTSAGPHEKVLGTASGKGHNLQDAVKNAIGTSGADTLINVFIDNEMRCSMDAMGATVCLPTGIVRIFGTLVKYE